MFSWLGKDEARNKQPEIYDRYALYDQLVGKQIIFPELNKIFQVLNYFGCEPFTVAWCFQF
jgi:hypothetical protein